MGPVNCRSYCHYFDVNLSKPYISHYEILQYLQYGVERFENGFLGAHMTHRTQSLHFAGATWSHGLRALSNPVGHAYMTHMVAGGRWPVSDGMQHGRSCPHDPHPHGQPLAILTSITLAILTSITLAILPTICLPFWSWFWPRGEG
jgi:hypothetical protein